ncbi:desmoglein-2-like, partial [Neolamprologus brichardi]|uniref:desmoglein-2-like n=1 Tax=Neolamprologus brichardi TaxID=32507 RepID=UPI0016439D76
CTFSSLFVHLQLVSVGAEGNGRLLHRQKRHWIAPPRKLYENHDYTGLNCFARIRSDKEEYAKMLYYITGPGADQDPVGRFRIDHSTGCLRVYSILDREEIAFYRLRGVARYINGTQAENYIDLNITVDDENDNSPVIQLQQVGYVNESSRSGVVIMKIIATDADDERTKNAQLSYSIVEQANTAGLFWMNSHTGELTVQSTSLDREKQDTYKLMIKVCDLNGDPGGRTSTGEVEIRLLDINDNIPTLEKETYEGRIEENTVGVEVMRIKAIDMDLIHTDNWLAAYQIVSGNEGGYFDITTDAKTNEGIIMVRKALDYEELKVMNLHVMVSNKAAYNFGSSQSATGATGIKTYPVTINVVNQKEGPRFQPSVKVVTVSEEYTSTSLSKVITNYAAIDTDTQKIATNVRYAKHRDIDNWLIIDEKTADIRLSKLPDRESVHLINGTYYAEIICMTNDLPSKTATGTIAIQVEDFNDHCPTLTSKTQTMCLQDSVIYVTAVDEDHFPNSSPFEFTVVEEGTTGKWRVEHFNETTVILREENYVWPGVHKVTLKITDQQGKSCADAQIIDLTVCTCNKNTRSCVSRSTSTATFGAGGILLMLLGLLLLLLVPLLLLFCLCGSTAAIGDFKSIPYDTKQQLISYHTEGQGEDKEVPLMHVPVEVDGGAVTKDVNMFEGHGYYGGLAELGGAAGGRGPYKGSAIYTSNMTADNMNLYNQYKYSSGQNMDFLNTGTMARQDMNFSQYRGGAWDGIALSEEFLWDYYSRKSDHAAQQPQVKDSMLIHNYEGQESLAGSVGCCSLLENDDDLAFLNDLGPKFKTLAEICQGSTMVTESVDVAVSSTPVRPVSPFRPSTSTHTHVRSHTETIRDRDRVNINTLNTSNVSSGSSTVIQEERITGRAQSSATLPNVHVQDNIVIPSQTLLIQQPAMYYAATPMYVVESKPQVMLVAGGTQQAVGSVGQAGLSHGLVQVSGLQSSQGVVLVDRQGGMGEVTGQAAQGLSRGTISRSRQLLVVENGSSGGEQGVHLAQGVVQTGQRSAEQGFEVRSVPVKAQGFSVGSHSSLGSNEEAKLTVTPKSQGTKRVVVQQKKILVTERNLESSSRA